MLLNRSIKTIFDRKWDRLREIKGKKRKLEKNPGGKALKLKEKKEEK